MEWKYNRFSNLKVLMEIKKSLFIILIFIIVGSGFFSFCRKLVVLKELAKPVEIIMDKQLFLINDETNQLHLYSFKDFKYLAQMCRYGEGPGEAQYVGHIILKRDYIFRYIMGKNIYYSRDGKFQKEFKTRSQMTSFNYPVGDKFVSKHSIKRNGDEDFSNDISLYSYVPEKGMVYEKLLYWYKDEPLILKGSRRPYRFFHENHDVVIYEDKIFIGDSTRGVFVQVYDRDGNKISQVKFTIEKEDFPDSYEKELTKIMKSNGQWNFFTNQYYFEERGYYPYFYRFFIGKNRIYFLTFKRKADQREVVITDWQGKLIKKAYIPWGELLNVNRNFTIYEEKFYYLFDNQDTEEWELHVVDIK